MYVLTTIVHFFLVGENEKKWENAISRSQGEPTFLFVPVLLLAHFSHPQLGNFYVVNVFVFPDCIRWPSFFQKNSQLTSVFIFQVKWVFCFWLAISNKMQIFAR